MARFFFTDRFNALNSWSGRLFEATTGTVVNTATATAYTFTLPAGHPFAGYKILVQGTGFTYLGSVVTGGTMSNVRVINDLGQSVLFIDNLAPNTLASDLVQFVTNAFGWKDHLGDGPDPDGKMVWNHLLSGNDTFFGTNGDDQNTQGVNGGNDVFNMLGGDDEVAGGIGADTINGGAGFDVLDFSNTSFNEGGSAYRGITALMALGKVTDPWGFVDTFSGIEAIVGSRFNDVIVGTGGRDQFTGLRGSDTINGGADSDTIRYDSDTWNGGTAGIFVDLQITMAGGAIGGYIRDGFGTVDRVTDIERVIGTIYNDVFYGSTVNNHFWGGEGTDYYNGDAGSDWLRFDRWFENAPTSGVVVDMSLATNQIINDGHGNTEKIFNIENIVGNNLNDSIIGSAGDNYLVGRDGSDTLTGGGGIDYFEFWNQGDADDNDLITDFTASGAASEIDVLSFDSQGFAGMTTTLTLVNGTVATSAVGTFLFDDATDHLFWDSDGTGAAGPILVATLSGVSALSAANFDLY